MARIRNKRTHIQGQLTEATGATALYLRVSTASQVDDGFGLDAQRARLDAYCTAHGWEVDPAHIYTDAGVTGTSTDQRDRLRAMMDAARRGEVRRIVAVKLDRLARNVRDFLTIAEELRGLGVDLVLIAESFDTSTPTGQFALTMFAAMAQLEAATITERVMSGKRAKAAQGGYNGAPVPLGYEHTADGLAVADAEAATVRRIFSAFVGGAALLHIADGLNRDGVATKRGGRWYASTVRHVVNNGAYAGLAQWDGVEVDSTAYPAIVERGVYEAAAARLACLPMGPVGRAK